MKCYILVRKKTTKVPNLLTGGHRYAETLDDIHNNAFISKDDADKYIKGMLKQDRDMTCLVELKLNGYETVQA